MLPSSLFTANSPSGRQWGRRQLMWLLALPFLFIGQSAQAASCFAEVHLEAGFVALTTNRQSELAAWYRQTFGLEIAKEFAFPDGKVTGVLMRKDEFVVEVFNRDDALIGTSLVPAAQGEQWTGLMKFGVYSDADLLLLRQCLRGQGVAATRIFKDTNLNVDLLLVTDPEGNFIEIISRHPDKAA